MPTDLFARISSPNSLWEAWARVRRGGKAPGLDGVTIAQFDFHAERELRRLREELLDGRYRPWPARRVVLPKTDGGSRQIGIQAIRDRVAQRALLGLLQPRVEPLLEECSYAYRPRRSVEMALAKLEEWRESGFGWVGRSDVVLCFDSLDRGRLEERLAPIVPEADVQRLIRLWLTAGVVDERGWSERGLGVSQGDVLSPLLCNLYLDPFDEAVTGHGHPLIRYADDFVVLGRSPEQARRGLECAGEALAALGLRLNAPKSQVSTFIHGFEYLGAAVVGSMLLPLHRVERPGRPPRFVFGYGPPRELRASRAQRPRAHLMPPLVGTETALRDRMVALLRAERAGRALPPMAAALLRAWQAAGAARLEPPEPEGWESVYLI
jgi:group II intron reverse transcriptase/maturase